MPFPSWGTRDVSVKGEHSSAIQESNSNILLLYTEWPDKSIQDAVCVSAKQNITSITVMIGKSHRETVFKSNIPQIKSSLLFSSEVEKRRIWELKWTLGKTKQPITYKVDFKTKNNTQKWT